MADRVEMTAPSGAGRAKVAKARVEEFKANGWREVTPARPKRRKRPSSDEGDK